MLICGMHGDEITGLMVLRALLQGLRLKKGTLTIIPAANPLAQALKKRENPEDSRDLNRSFPGERRGKGTSSRLARAILEEAESHDLVVDLHAFSNKSPVVGIFFNHGPESCRSRSLELIKAFNPELVWRLDLKTKEETQLSGSLLPILAKNGKIVFGVEFPRQYWLKEGQIERSKKGLLNVLALMGMGEKANVAEQEQVTIFERQQFFTDKAGLFSPEALPKQQVKKGDRLGTLTSLLTLNTEVVFSPFEGILTSIADFSVVNTGDKVFTIGKQIGVL